MESNGEDRLTNWGVVVFPGSNCDHDAVDAFGKNSGQGVREVWHRETSLDGLDGVMLPGGFSYGDYLRSGAIARFAPIMESFIRFAESGGVVLGVCNGFQVLTEAGLLPGALMRNSNLRFICRDIYIRVERTNTPFTSRYNVGDVLTIPIAHNEGNYYLSEEDLELLEANHQVVFRYCDRQGRVSSNANPNGSLNNIAGIVSRRGNVLGMMPHPERRCDPLLGQPDGLPLFQSMIDFARNR